MRLIAAAALVFACLGSAFAQEWKGWMLLSESELVEKLEELSPSTLVNFSDKPEYAGKKYVREIGSSGTLDGSIEIRQVLGNRLAILKLGYRYSDRGLMSTDWVEVAASGFDFTGLVDGQAMKDPGPVKFAGTITLDLVNGATTRLRLIEPFKGATERREWPKLDHVREWKFDDGRKVLAKYLGSRGNEVLLLTTEWEAIKTSVFDLESSDYHDVMRMQYELRKYERHSKRLGRLLSENGPFNKIFEMVSLEPRVTGHTQDQ